MILVHTDDTNLYRQYWSYQWYWLKPATVLTSYLSMVSCQKGPTRHAYAWPIGLFWQDSGYPRYVVLHLSFVSHVPFLFNNDHRLLTLPVTWRSRDPARSAPCSAPLHWPDRALATLTTRGRSSGTSGPSRARDRKHLAGSRAARALASCPWSRPLESRWREPVEPERE